MRAGVTELERQPCLPRRSHFCEGWSAARFVIREFFLLNSAFFPIGCGWDRTIKISQSVP